MQTNPVRVFPPTATTWTPTSLLASPIKLVSSKRKRVADPVTETGFGKKRHLHDVHGGREEPCRNMHCSSGSKAECVIYAPALHGFSGARRVKAELPLPFDLSPDASNDATSGQRNPQRPRPTPVGGKRASRVQAPIMLRIRIPPTMRSGFPKIAAPLTPPRTPPTRVQLLASSHESPSFLPPSPPSSPQRTGERLVIRLRVPASMRRKA